MRHTDNGLPIDSDGIAGWQPRQWMLPYLEQLSCGRERVGELMNDSTPVQINAPLALLAVATKAEVGLLMRLHGAGLLMRPDKTERER